MLPPEAVQEAKKIYFEEFKEELSDDEALDFCVNLLTAFSHVFRPVKKEWLHEFLNKEVVKSNKDEFLAKTEL